MSHRVKKKHVFNANLSLPEGLGTLLLEEVMNLPSSRKADYLKSEYLSKFVSSDTDSPELRKSRAIEKWLATERTNEVTNDRLINTHPDFQVLRDVKFVDFVEFLQSVVCDIIGDTVPEEALCGAFSGGASTSRIRTKSQPALKYLGQAHVTKRASEWLPVLADELPGWSQFWGDLDFQVTNGNVMFTVPKTTIIDRCACKEPDINMFIQKGAGRVIQRALKKAGIDLNDQSRNRNLAREGSKTGMLATIDLSSASDSVSRELVYTALPICWFTFLDSIRSPNTEIGKDVHVNEMFSSMGNGFTFELESLLFYALARTTAYFTGTRGVISVYGDDLIVPSTMFPDLEWVLSYFGFTVNSKKSFFEGSFRESCGGHYDGGRDITPFYVKEPISTLSDLIKFCNALRRWSGIEGLEVLDPDAWDLWSFASGFIPKRFWGGHDTATRYQLCTLGLPKDRLVPDKIKEEQTGTGGYCHWLNASTFRERLNIAIVTSSTSKEVVPLRMKIRRALRTVYLDKPYFLTEI